METVTIPRARLRELEAKEKRLAVLSEDGVNWDFVNQVDESLNDYEEGRYTRIA